MVETAHLSALMNIGEQRFMTQHGENPMSKNRMIGVRVDADLEEKLKRAAEQDRRTVSQLARNILADALAPKQNQGAAA
jgi:hypothetical protein